MTDTAPGRAHMPLRLTLAVIVAYAAGWGLAHVPAPDDPSIFWLGNLAAPYLVVAFISGGLARRGTVAAFAGALAAMAAVAGFYGFLTVGDVTNSQMDLPATVTARSVVLRSYGHWFANLLWGDPGGIPWLAIALVAGAAFGVLGYRWRVRGSAVGLAGLGLALVIEPLVYVARINVALTGAPYGLGTRNLLIWLVELAVGAFLIVWALRGRTRTAQSAA